MANRENMTAAQIDSRDFRAAKCHAATEVIRPVIVDIRCSRDIWC